MAKNMGEDFSVLEVPAKAARLAVGGVMNPSDKIGLLVRYENGRKEDAIGAVFDVFSGGKGLVIRVKACGISRNFLDPESFPKNNMYVPGKEGEGMMFIRYEEIR